MVLVASRGISRVPRYSGTCREPVVCRLPGCHRLWPIVPDRSTSRLVAHSLALKPDRPYNPTVQARWFGLFRVRSPLLAESLLFSLPVGTEMFHFPTFPPHTLYIQGRVTGHDSSWVSPFGHPRINARLPTPQGLSQAPTSFIGS